MTVIQSLVNEKIKHVVALQKASYRKEHGQFVAQGDKVCQTLLGTGFELVSAYMTESAFSDYPNLFSEKKLTLVSAAVMKKMSTVQTPTGIVAIFQIPKSNGDLSANSVLLYNIQDPGNLGTLIRTAAAMKFDHVILIGGADVYQPKVVQACAGTLGYVNIVQTEWSTLRVNHKNLKFCALVVDNGKSEQDIALKDYVLVLGNEGQGLPDQVIDSCDAQMTIAMPGNTESLNVAIAGAIAMFLKSKR
jgi:TrmH family RNA methyltransferase